METKACTKCGEVKPITTGFYATYRRGTRIYTSACKACVIAAQSARDKSHKKPRPVGGYPWPPLDPLTLALQHFGHITRTGQLVPMIRAEVAA